MNTNQEQLERVANLLKQAGAVLETIDLTPRPSPAEVFLRTLAVNLDNAYLSDADFVSLPATPCLEPSSLKTGRWF